MRYQAIVVAGILAAFSATQGQVVNQQTFQVKRTRLELRPFTGKYIPHGDQRRDFHSAPTNGVQAALQVGPWTHVVASASWTDGRSKLAALKYFPTTRLWQYDAGVEFNTVQPIGRRLLLLPSFGFGAGARNYYYPSKG